MEFPSLVFILYVMYSVFMSQTYDWDEKTQGLVLSSFFWGYFLMQLPAGIITERFGGHRFLCLAVLGSSLLTLFLPLCAYIGGWLLVCINRMLQGLTQVKCVADFATTFQCKKGINRWVRA